MAFICYAECPKCKKVTELITTVIRDKLSVIEVKQREIVKKMVRDLLGKKTPLIKFPATSRPEVNCCHCNLKEKIWGWTSQIGERITISFPRQNLSFSLQKWIW